MPITLDGVEAGSDVTTPAPRRVYDADTVDAYVQSLKSSLDALRRELDETRQRLATAEDPSRVPPAIEAMIGRALLTAQRLADETLAQAKAEAAAILAAAGKDPADRKDAATGKDRADGKDAATGPALDSKASNGKGNGHLPAGPARLPSRRSQTGTPAVEATELEDVAKRWRDVKPDDDVYADLRAALAEDAPLGPTKRAPRRRLSMARTALTLFTWLGLT